MYEGRKHYFILHFPQRSGALLEFVSEVLGQEMTLLLSNIRKNQPEMTGLYLLV